jgi:ferredoxin
VYCIVPEALLRAVEQAHAARDRDRLHVERFAPVAPAAGRADGAFTVELRRSGRELEVPADRTVVQVLAEAGVEVLSTCEEGTCGTCETAVRAGRPDQRDSLLSPAEREAGQSMIICAAEPDAAAGARPVTRGDDPVHPADEGTAA